MELIRLEDVWYRYPESDWVLQGVSLSIRKGEFVVITGPSGGGKSTLCRVIMGLAKRFYGGELRGCIKVMGRSIDELKPWEISKVIGFVSQNPENQVATLVVEEEIAFPLENMGIDRDEILKRVDWALRIVGIEDLRRRLLYTLSAGELQKVVLATVLAMKPRVLLLDEPLSHLDPWSARNFVSLLRNLWEEGMTIVVVEHRLCELLKYATRLIVLNRRIIADDEPRRVVRSGILDRMGVEVPPVARLAIALGINSTPLTVEEALNSLKRFLTCLTQQ